MKKQEFLAILRANLSGIGEDDIQDIMYDYEEHFRIGLENNKTEEEISEALGNPVQIASAYKADSFIKKVEISPRPYNMFKAILAGIGLGLFNITFVIGIYAGVIGLVIGLGGVALGITFSGVILMIDPFFVFKYVNTPFNLSMGLGKLACFISGTAAFSLGILLIILTVFISKLIFKMTIAYIKANVEVIKKAGK